jgi:Tol biopolymer transport system component
MSLIAGTCLGPYEILSPLGSGGMGEVYRARDTKLNRDVAIKVLPDLFASDPERLARFQREAQVLASLNHPNISHIYGLEESHGIRALVMELVEGPTLADRIAQGPIALDDALLVARQIAEALEAAHEQGIIHRDLKPANIKLRPDGTVKVLDFGLAKLADPVGVASGPASASMSPTLSIQATYAGVILGTAAYMSPEQARGKEVDKRTDIWAFGVVFYEMLTGQRLFAGEEISDTLASVLRTDPNWSALPADTPASIRRLLRRCLEKDRKERLPDIVGARLDIKDAHAEPKGLLPPVAPAPSRTRERLAWGAACLFLTLGGVLGVSYFRKPADPPELRTDIITPATPDPMSFAISPDARQVVFVASGDGPTRLWLRWLDATTAQPLPGTEGAAYPFWSPNSRSVGFVANNKLKRLDLGAGLPQPLADVTTLGRGGTWSSDGVILFSRNGTSGLYRVPASGGETVVATKLGASQINNTFPQFLPGGRQFIFYARGQADAQGIYLGSLDTAETKRLVATTSAGAYAPPGWLLFIRGATLVARRFDTAQGTLTGDPVTVADPVGADAFSAASAVSVSAAGPMLYRAGAASRRQLTWFDRSGKALETLGTPDDNNFIAPAVSPDGRRVAVHRTVQGNIDVWLIDAVRTSRFTVDPGSDGFPVWSPDGSRIAFRSNRKGHFDLYVKASSGAGGEDLLVESPRVKTPNDWSRDGRYLLYTVTDDPKTGFDQWVLPLEGDRKPFPFLNAIWDEQNGQFSPDGRWVAYQSNESGRHEIYVRPFPGPGGQLLVSTAGGISPRWRPDGKELYYIAPDATLMAAPLAVKGGTLEPGTPAPLFRSRIWGGGTDLYQRDQYDVARDGRFLINVTTDDTVTSPITLLQNWKPEP